MTEHPEVGQPSDQDLPFELVGDVPGLSLADQVHNAFAPQGIRARAWDNYTPRQEQLNMACAVAQTLEEGGALVVEAGWSMLAAEVFDFQDFCRLRLLEAQLRGVTPGRFPFGRPEWQAARRAEAILRSQQRILRQRFHRSAPLEPFRIR